MTSQEEKANARGEQDGSTYIFRFSGNWTTGAAPPHWSKALQELREADDVKELRFDMSEVERFDSVLASYLLNLTEGAESLELRVDRESLSPELRRLLELAQTTPEKTKGEKEEEERGVLARVGRWSLDFYDGLQSALDFVGESVLAALRLVSGRSKLRWKEFWSVMEAVSIKALPIVSLISFLVGLIISFLGAVTLRQFGAEFAVAYLVGYGMLREMGAMMTGIIMAGRTGAAFAAQIGSMKVNEEIDALKTFGIHPYDFLVLPRLLALFLMLPVLTFYANVIGILSGWMVAEYAMGVPGPVFFEEMKRVVDLSDFLLGIFKAAVFGLLIGVSGCLRGLQSGSGADAVGRAATNAVVTGITLIIFANAVIDWAASVLDI